MAADGKATSISLEEVVDVQKLDAAQPQKAIRKVKSDRRVQKVHCDLLIVGGGTGGVAAALAATGAGNLKVCLTEETDWLGGQMTAQGVSALDENYLVEKSGAAGSYRDFRTAIRNYYKTKTKLTEEAAAQTHLNPGNCWVSWLAFEPKVAVAELTARLKPSLDAGRLATYLRFKPVYVTSTTKKDKSTVAAVGMVNLDSGEVTEFHAKFFIDATELGELLPLSNLPYSSGSDSFELTHEPHAPKVGDPQNVQDFVFPFVIEYRPGEHHTIEKPELFEEFNKRGKFSFQGYKMFESAFGKEPGGIERELLPFWTYRRLIDRSYFADPQYPYDVAMINWDSNDLRSENIIDQPAATQAQRLAKAKLLSLGFLYWLQTEVERDDGGKGYPELMLRTDVLGTSDGLSKYPYIRESRRIHAQKTIVEQDIVAATNAGARAKLHDDSVGIGLYPVDIHGHQEVPGAGQSSLPFQIPLSALIPKQAHNLLPACKNIGTTHITNGAYRLHPIEWAIGEAQGTFARQLINSGHSPAAVLEKPERLRALQMELIEGGSPTFWFDDVATDHPHFVAIQYLATAGILTGSDDDLHFRPDAVVTESEVVKALSNLYPTSARPDATNNNATATFLKSLKFSGHHFFKSVSHSSEETFTRSQFAELLFEVATHRARTSS